jgi:hypothetical protein
MGRTAPRRLSLWGHSALADAAPSEPRTTGDCIHRDQSRFWLQTAKLTHHGPTDEGWTSNDRTLVPIDSARSEDSVSGGPESGPPSASLALAPAEPQFRCRASSPPSGPHATAVFAGPAPPECK